MRTKDKAEEKLADKATNHLVRAQVSADSAGGEPIHVRRHPGIQQRAAGRGGYLCLREVINNG